MDSGEQLCHVAAVSGLMGMRPASGLSLANHSDSGAFLEALPWLSQDGRQRGGFWEAV